VLENKSWHSLVCGKRNAVKQAPFTLQFHYLGGPKVLKSLITADKVQLAIIDKNQSNNSME
jgi:hypothetical protein